MMRTASESEIQMAENPGKPRVGDDTLWVHFYMGAIPNQQRTEELRAKGIKHQVIFDDAVFVQIEVPGDRTLSYNQPAVIDEESAHNMEAHNNRFPKQWEAFKAGMDSAEAGGTPLKAVRFVSVRQQEELKFQKIVTVEQLASLSDASMSRLGSGYVELRARAIAFVEAQKAAAPAAHMQAELSKRDDDIADLRKQLEALQGKKPAPRLEAAPDEASATPAEKPKRGRPAKAKAAAPIP